VRDDGECLNRSVYGYPLGALAASGSVTGSTAWAVAQKINFSVWLVAASPENPRAATHQITPKQTETNGKKLPN